MKKLDVFFWIGSFALCCFGMGLFVAVAVYDIGVKVPTHQILWVICPVWGAISLMIGLDRYKKI